MARARNLKPGFFRDSKVVACSFAARLLFQGLWCMADYMGRLKYDPLEIKMELFPADDVDVSACVKELSDNGLIEMYHDHSGAALVQVRNFSKHQNPHVNERQDRNKKPLPCLPSPEECENARLKTPCEKKHIKQQLEDALRVLREYSESDPADSLNLIPDSLLLIPESAPPTSNAREQNFEEPPPCILPEFQYLPRGIPISEWQVSQEIPEALQSSFGVPAEFIAEELQEFLFYWKDRDTPSESWDAKFFKRCQAQWKLNKHSWRPDHETSQSNQPDSQASGGKLSSIERANAKTREYIASLGGGADPEQPPDHDGQALVAVDQ